MTIASVYATIGPAGVALVGVACLALYLSLKNYLYMFMVRRDFNKNFRDIEDQCGACLHDVCNRSKNPLIAIVRDVVQVHAGHSEDIRAEVAYLFHRNFEPVMKGLYYLRLISVIAPLMGLLGTVLGMVSVFRVIAASSSPAPAILAAGIWEALITTVMGLCVAIPTLMVYYILTLKFKGFHIEAVEYSYRAIELCAGGKRPASRDAAPGAVQAQSGEASGATVSPFRPARLGQTAGGRGND